MTRREVSPGFFLNTETGGAGPPLVLLHGFTGSARAWGPFLDALTAHCTVVAVDIAGHGASDSPAALDHYRMPQVAEDIVRLVKMAGHERAAWLGYSMGGRTALHIAAAHTTAVERLVLIGGSPGIAGDEARVARVAADEALAARIVCDGIVPFVNYWEAIPLFESQRALPPGTRAAIRAGRLECEPRGLANSLRGMGAGAQEPLHSRLGSLGIPVLLLAGALDPRYAELATEMSAAMPCARAATIPAAGHAAHIENPKETAAAVLAFLQSSPGVCQ